MRLSGLRLFTRESGGIGRRAGLRIQSRKGWEFESPLSHLTAETQSYKIISRMSKIVIVVLLLMISTARLASPSTPHFQKCPPYFDVPLNWAGQNYDIALDAVMPLLDAQSAQNKQWILSVRITPSFFDELQFTFIRNPDRTVKVFAVAPTHGKISSQLEEIEGNIP